VHLARLSAPEFTAQIDRLSVGVQSFYDHYLKQIGRYAKFGSAAAQYKAVAQANGVFKTVNVDMIYNFPGQSEAELQEEIDTLLKLRPAQITFYPLMYSPATGAKLQKQWGALSSGREAKLSAVIREGLTGKYVQRSAWAWSLEKTGIIDEYVGAGSGAFSFLGGRLYANTFSLPEYARLIDAGRTGATRTADFSSRSIAQYRAMVDLFGLKPPRSLWPETTLLKLVGAYDRTGVTPRGAYVASAMMREFYNGMDYIRQTMRQSLKPEDGLINS
jgi:coproporphyrinogen III oxidase-like Fe-S oxidoreductase